MVSLSGLRIWRCRELWWVTDVAQIPHCFGPGGRPAATALIRPLAWETPYAAGAALEKAKSQKKKLTFSLL